MIFKKSHVLLFILISLVVTAQDDMVLFTVDDKPVKTAEFLNVYNKNIDILTDESQKDIKNYFELYVNYKLKIAQARELGFDTLTPYKKELDIYKKQLMAPYLKDDEFIDNLVKEAYERSLIEINASHILIMIAPRSVDTIQAFSKINEARKLIVEGASFEEIAKQYSEDQSVKSNGGNLGYSSVFDMVYPFENVIYNTAKGEVSKPFKTRFGYHIVKINEIRKASGEVEAAHILVKGDSISSELKIKELYNNIIIDNEDFSYLAKTYSDDKFTATKGGSLGKFGSGKMVKKFEEVSFSLENEGDISKPFKTQYGWHIIKLVKKYPVKSFEEQELDLKKRVKRGDRASIVSNSIVHKIKDNYTIVINKRALAIFKAHDWKNSKNLSKELLSIDGYSVSQVDLVSYLKDKDFTMQLFEKFKNYQILEYYKTHLEETNKEFAQSYKEYKEGLLLFDLLQKKIWDKSKDSIGVQVYYKKYKSNYKLPLEEIRGVVINDYQEYLEKQWVEELHNSYKVVINDDEFNRLVENHR